MVALQLRQLDVLLRHRPPRTSGVPLSMRSGSWGPVSRPSSSGSAPSPAPRPSAGARVSFGVGPPRRSGARGLNGPGRPRCRGPTASDRLSPRTRCPCCRTSAGQSVAGAGASLALERDVLVLLADSARAAFIHDLLTELVDVVADRGVAGVIPDRDGAAVGRRDRVVVADELVDQRVRARCPRVADGAAVERRDRAERRPGSRPRAAPRPGTGAVSVVLSRNGSRNPS